jgi:putative transposase
MTHEEYEIMQRKALEQLRSGKSLTGKDGAFAPLLKQFLESALEAARWKNISAQRNALRKTNATAKARKPSRPAQAKSIFLHLKTGIQASSLR